MSETNKRIQGSEDTKVLKPHKECFQACHKGMVGSEVFVSSQHNIYSSTSYRIHDQIVKPTPQVLDADHDLFASAESVVSIKASEFTALESIIRGSLSVLSYIEHFYVASTKLLRQLLEVGQPECSGVSVTMCPVVTNLKLSHARAIPHLANIEAKTFGNLVLARRDYFLTRSKVSGDQQLENFLRTTSSTHSSLFASQFTPVSKELLERNEMVVGSSNARSSTSTITALQQVHFAWGRAQPAKPHGSRQPFSSTPSPQITPGKRQGRQSQEAPAKKPQSAPKNL